MKRDKKLFKVLVVLIITAGVIIISCTKKLDQSNPSFITLDSYFKNSSELLSGTNAIYSVFHGGGLIGREWFFLHDLRSDDVTSGGGQLEVPRAQILNGSMTADNSVMNSVWNGLYIVIHRANTVIANSANVTDNDELKNRCIAEAKFFRGWAYYELVSMWGPVPLYTEPVKTPDQYQSRASEDVVYTQIIQDLTEAAAVLPASYTSGDLGRATSSAANAMLGRAYMQKGDYAGAKTALEKVKNSGLYHLVDEYDDNFKEETEFNPESVFEAVFIDKGDNSFDWGYTGDGANNAQASVRNQEYCPVAWRNLIPSNHFLAEFESTAKGAAKTDPRLGYTVYQTGDKFNNGNTTLTADMQNGNASTLNGQTVKISWRKFMLIYKQDLSTASFHPGGNNQRIIRYAEILINLAECENELGNKDAAVAYLNQVRDRPSVAMPHYPTAQYPTGTKEQVMKAIMHEKTAELGDEELRNVDIIRWRKMGYFTNGDPLPYFKANRDELLPIPQSEISNNPKLGEGGTATQNPGY